jgi:hypothetical protein
MNVALTTTNTAPDVTAIERVERDAWLDLFAAVPAAYAISDSVLSRKSDACALLAHKGIPISEFNRAIGTSIDRPIAASDFDQAIEWLDANANSAWVIQLAPNKRLAEIEAWLARHRLKPSGNGWAKFERMPFAASPPARRTSLSVHEVDTSTADDFGFVVASGFGLPASIAPWFSALAGRPKWQCYLAYDGPHPVACGALYPDSRWAWMGIDATLPAYRGRGAQTALIDRRITDGVAAGVKGFTAETGQPSKVQSSHSYQNYQRANFRKSYVRPNCPEAHRGVPAGTRDEPFRPGCCTVRPPCPSRALHTLEGSPVKPHHAATLLSTAKTTLLPANDSLDIQNGLAFCRAIRQQPGST